jgi:hypothetical protein
MIPLSSARSDVQPDDEPVQRSLSAPARRQLVSRASSVVCPGRSAATIQPRSKLKTSSLSATETPVLRHAARPLTFSVILPHTLFVSMYAGWTSWL